MESMQEITNFFATQGGNKDKDDPVIVVGSPNALGLFYDKVRKKYNLDELGVILETNENMLIVAGAGAGKTTGLILKIIRDILSGRLLQYEEINGVTHLSLKKILVSTFLKSGAEDLAETFDEMCKEFNISGVTSSRIAFRTIHSEVYQALKEMGVQISIGDSAKIRSCLAATCKMYNVKSTMVKGAKNLNKEEMGDMESLFSYMRNKLDDSRFNHPLMTEYNLDPTTITAMLEEFKTRKRLLGLQDFEDLQEMLLEGYANQNVIDIIKNRYDFMYVDEFQDTSQLQYKVLEPYFKYAEGFLCIGDDDQCIYGWRGSDVNLIQEIFEKDYKPTIRHLTVNRRCPSNILKAVIPSIEKNEGRHPKVLRSARDGGEVNIILTSPINHFIQSLRQDITTDNDIAVIARTNADLLIPTLILLVDGYEDFSVSNTLSLYSTLPSQVFGIMSLITQRYNNDFESYFNMFLSKGQGYEATKLANMLANNPSKTLFNIDMDDLRYSVPNLAIYIRQIRDDYEKDPKEAYVNLLLNMNRYVYTSNNIFAQKARDFVKLVVDMIKEHPRLKDRTLEELGHIFRNVLPEKLENKKKKDAKVKVSKAKIRLTTVHDAKGKEWDRVYIWNDKNNCFPNAVGKRGLTHDELEEERRVHYIAWTRPRQVLNVYTIPDDMQGFIGECALDTVSWITGYENTNIEKHNAIVKRQEKRRGIKDSSIDIAKDEINITAKDIMWRLNELHNFNSINSPIKEKVDYCLEKYDFDTFVTKIRDIKLGDTHIVKKARNNVPLEVYIDYLITEVYTALVLSTNS